MKIQVWVDFVCPYCYIAKKNFDTASAAFPEKDLALEPLSFQLNPDLVYAGETVVEHLAKSYGVSLEEASGKNQHSEALAASVGLEINNDTAKVTNTRDAHRVMQMAKTLGLATAVFDRIQKAYFIEGALISDHETLASLAADVGMDQAAVLAMLKTDQFEQEVQAEHDRAVEKNIQYVPHFVFPSGEFIEGVLSAKEITEALSVL